MCVCVCAGVNGSEHAVLQVSTERIMDKADSLTYSVKNVV